MHESLNPPTVTPSSTQATPPSHPPAVVDSDYLRRLGDRVREARARRGMTRRILSRDSRSTTDPVMPFNGGQLKLFGINRGSSVLSAKQTLSIWTKNAKCKGPSQFAALAAIAPNDGTSITRTAYTSCFDGTSVVLYTVIGGGHAWPGGRQYAPKCIIGLASAQLNASQTIVEFFLAHPMR